MKYSKLLEAAGECKTELALFIDYQIHYVSEALDNSKQMLKDALSDDPDTDISEFEEAIEYYEFQLNFYNEFLLVVLKG